MKPSDHINENPVDIDTTPFDGYSELVNYFQNK